MVAEMTGNLSLLAPAMVAVALSTALVGDHTIYTSQLPTRADSPAHRVRFGFPLLASLRVRDAMRAATNGLQPLATAVVSPDDPLDQALATLIEANGNAVVREGEAVVGTLTARDALMEYRAALGRGTRRIGALGPAATMLEARLAPGSPLAGRTLREAGIGPDALILAISREGEAIFPRAETALRAGDQITLLADPAAERRLRDLFAGNDRA
jgi:CIC family chloride channel protein